MMRLLMIRATRSRAPKHRHVCLACDANSSLDGLANVEGYDEVIGPVIHHLTEKGPRTHRRARALASVCHEWQMKACNTFPHHGPRRDGFQNDSFSPEFHDSWTYSSYSKNGVKKQMDFICASHTLDTSNNVLYGIDCGSDHKLFVCSCSVDLAGTGAAVPNRPCTPQARASR